MDLKELEHYIKLLFPEKKFICEFYNGSDLCIINAKVRGYRNVSMPIAHINLYENKIVLARVPEMREIYIRLNKIFKMPLCPRKVSKEYFSRERFIYGDLYEITPRKY